MKQVVLVIILFSATIYTCIVYRYCSAGNIVAANDSQARGKLLWQEYNCCSCHQIYGLGGYMGPDLTNIISTKGKGELYAKAFMQSGTSKMPNFHLKNNEIQDLTNYLKQVDNTGVYPIQQPDITSWGNIIVASKINPVENK